MAVVVVMMVLDNDLANALFFLALFVNSNLQSNMLDHIPTENLISMSMDHIFIAKI